MLQPIIHLLNSQNIVLASASPRRKSILENVGLKFTVMPSTFEEKLDKTIFQHPADYVKETARQKVLEILSRLKEKNQDCPHLVIGADTIVTMDNQIFEKPLNRADAYKMLSGYSGKSHTVITGVVLAFSNPNDLSEETSFSIFHNATEVKFASMPTNVINAYIDTGEPFDKAGGYGIQQIGGTCVEKINGDYFNVMGFPLHQFAQTLLEYYKENYKDVFQD